MDKTTHDSDRARKLIVIVSHHEDQLLVYFAGGKARNRCDRRRATPALEQDKRDLYGSLAGST